MSGICLHINTNVIGVLRTVFWSRKIKYNNGRTTLEGRATPLTDDTSIILLLSYSRLRYFENKEEIRRVVQDKYF